MKKIAALFCSAILTLGMAKEASALFVISNASMTTNSVTFTIDGDMTGYAAPNVLYEPAIRLVYSGDIYTSPGESSFTPNVWSDSMFDNHFISISGNTGTWSGNNYTWANYDSSLFDAVATNRTVTITTGNYFNPSAAGTISFYWGSPFESPASKIGEATFPVPEPSALMLLGIGGLGVMGMTRGKHRKSLDVA